MNVTDRRLEEAIRHFHPPTGFRPWHGGPSFLGALRGVGADTALWKPRPDRHSIWELALHISYWNYAVRRRIKNEPSGGFPRSPSDWPAIPEEPSEASWKKDRELVKSEHDRLLETLENFDSTRLDDFAGENTQTTYADLITGVVLHDTYHTAQIQLMKRMAP